MVLSLLYLPKCKEIYVKWYMIGTVKVNVQILKIDGF